jgi:hypothetical protein
MRVGLSQEVEAGHRMPVSRLDTLRAGQKEHLVDGTGCQRADWSTQGRPQCQRAIAPHAHPKQANRSLHGRTTPAVRPTIPSMGWTPRPKPCGTPPKIRHVVPRRTISREPRSLTGRVSRRESEWVQDGSQKHGARDGNKSRITRRRSDESGAVQTRPCDAIEYQHLRHGACLWCPLV